MAKTNRPGTEDSGFVRRTLAAVVSGAVRERCGCGTSFSFGIPVKKLSALKALYAEKPLWKIPPEK